MFMLGRIIEPLGAFLKVPTEAPPKPAERPLEKSALAEDAAMLLVRNTTGKYEQTILLMTGVEIEIGRYLGAPITSSRPRYELPNASVSAKHAFMGVDETGVYIIDVGTEGNGSRNGTFLNGVRVEPRRKFYLSSTDEIWLGKPHAAMSERLTVNCDRTKSTVSVAFQTFAAR
jgi:hypothetical protein